LHGRVEGVQRDATMEAFRNGESNVLITTNVLARGVDVDNVRIDWEYLRHTLFLSNTISLLIRSLTNPHARAISLDSL